MKKEDWKNLWNQCFGKEKNERAHAVAMLIIMGTLIGILILAIRMTPLPEEGIDSSPQSTANAEHPQLSDETQELQTELEANSNGNYEINYSYLCTFTENDQKQMITGKRLDEKEIFSIVDANGSQSYARLSKNYLKNEEGVYHLVEQPSEFLRYIDISTLANILEEEASTIDNNQYTYTLNNSILLENYYQDKKFVDTQGGTNTVILTVENGVIQRFDIDFSSLHTLLKGEPTTFYATIELQDIGSTEDFTIPLY